MMKTLKNKFIKKIICFCIGLLFIPIVGIAQNQSQVILEESSHPDDQVDKSTPDHLLKDLPVSADHLLRTEPYSVTHKSQFPPGVDKHNYVSYASYWWPNPDTNDGLPYIRKDGIRNKDLVKTGDAGKFHLMSQAVVLLTRTYKDTNDPKYAEKAADFLKVWFLNPDTKMNPNLDNGQMIMGKNQGTKSGLIELRYMISLTEVIPMLPTASYWTEQDQANLKNWFKEYYIWMISSKIGVQAATRFLNNHGSWYDAQLTSIALYLGRKDLAKTIFENAKTRRIAKQIEPDGKQPMELERTRALTYSLFNLEALIALSQLSKKVGIDLYNYETSDGRSIKKAYEFILPYKNNVDKWPYKQIDTVEDWRWQVIEDRDNILLNIYR